MADPVPWWENYVVRSSVPTLSIRASHVRTLSSLPDFHKDPFDRILVAQALAEELIAGQQGRDTGPLRNPLHLGLTYTLTVFPSSAASCAARVISFTFQISDRVMVGGLPLYVAWR